MASLQPVSHATVTLDQSGFKTRDFWTDADGHNEIDFFPHPTEQEPSVRVKTEGYRDGQIEDEDPESSYLNRPLEKRLKFIRELAPADLDAFPLRFPSGDISIPLDFVLVRENAPAKGVSPPLEKAGPEH